MTTRFARQAICCCGLLVLVLCARPAQATNLATFGLMLNSPVTPEGGQFVFGANEDWYGRVHLNGRAFLVMYPRFHSPFSQTEADVGNIPEEQFQDFFPSGYAIPHDHMLWPPTAALEDIRQHCLPLHHWIGAPDSLTTLIRFDGLVYHAAQYAEARIQGADTLWAVPWTTLPLPGTDEPQLIWVEGVARIKGIVEGQMTLLASDSLFIMGDLITADTDTVHYLDANLFGTTPPGSTQRIGLVGERDIIIAATLENGFANGANTPGVTCGLANHPVLQSFGQARKDVVICASLLALGCCFETEFWKTTAYNCSVPNPLQQSEGCVGLANSHVTIWDDTVGGIRPDCLGAAPLNDRRGTRWTCGSLTATVAGFSIRNNPGPWGQAWIGYTSKVIRFDPNLLDFPPPFWPEAIWVDDSPVSITLQTGSQSPCGDVTDPTAFLQDWATGAIALDLVAIDPQEEIGEQVLVLTRLNGQVVDSSWTDLSQDVPNLHWTPDYDLSPWLGQDVELRLEVQRGTRFILPDDPWPGGPQSFFEPLYDWNAQGEVCAWQWHSTAVQQSRTSGFQLSAPWPNPFNPVTYVELTLPAPQTLRLEVFDLAGRREAVIHDGPLPAGSHAFAIDGSGWPAGLHLMTLHHDGGMETRKILLLK